MAPITLTSTAARLRHEVTIRQFQLTVDEPIAAGGTDAGPTPTELVYAGLGSCKAITLKLYADRKGWPLSAVDAQISVLQNDQGPLVRVGLRLMGELDEAQRARLLEIADRCPVHRLLAPGMAIQTVLL